MMATEFRPKAVLITGGCGFVGASFINYAFERWPNTKFIAVDKLLSSADPNRIERDIRLSDRYKLELGDIANRKLMQKVLNDNKIDALINCASSPNVDAISSANNDVIGLTHLLEVCRDYGNLRVFVQISTSQAYGSTDSDQPPREQTALRPTNYKTASMAACEAMLNSYMVSYKMPIVVARLCALFGPGQPAHSHVHRLINNASQGVLVPTDAEKTACWLYIDDACDALLKLMEDVNSTKDGPFNVANNINTFELECAVAENCTDLGCVTMRGQAVKEIVDCDKITSSTGWKPKIHAQEGIRRTVEWYKSKSEKMETAPVRHEKVLIYGGRGWIGSQFADLLKQENMQFELAVNRPGEDTDDKVENEIIKHAPSHVISFLGRTHGPGCNTIEYLEGGAGKLKENVQNNLYAPVLLASLCTKLGVHITYFGTGCIFNYDQDGHRIGSGSGYTETDDPNYFGNSYSVVKGYTDRLMRQFGQTVLNVRIRLPVNFQLDKRNLVAKVIGYNKVLDVGNSITVLPHILPIVLRLMLQRTVGTLNATNPGPISLDNTLQLYRDLVDPSKSWQIMSAEDMPCTRANCELDTQRLQSLAPEVPSAMEGIKQAILAIKAEMGEQAKGRNNDA